MSFINKELLMQRATTLNSNIEVARKYYNSIYNKGDKIYGEKIHK